MTTCHLYNAYSCSVISAIFCMCWGREHGYTWKGRPGHREKLSKKCQVCAASNSKRLRTMVKSQSHSGMPLTLLLVRIG